MGFFLMTVSPQGKDLVANILFGRKAEPCSAKPAPSGQPASAEVVDFVANPLSQIRDLLG
jgi:hypothetical protein